MPILKGNPPSAHCLHTGWPWASMAYHRMTLANAVADPHQYADHITGHPHHIFLNLWGNPTLYWGYPGSFPAEPRSPSACKRHYPTVLFSGRKASVNNQTSNTTLISFGAISSLDRFNILHGSPNISMVLFYSTCIFNCPKTPPAFQLSSKTVYFSVNRVPIRVRINDFVSNNFQSPTR